MLSFSKLETIFCVFLPLKGVLKRVPFIGVMGRYKKPLPFWPFC